MNAKTTSLFSLVIIAFILSCKVGNEDPSLSFRTRKNRVTGDWKLKSGKTNYKESQPNGAIGYQEGFVFTATSYTYTIGSGPGMSAYAGGHTFNIKFEKNGDVKIMENFDGVQLEHSGKWDFNDGIGEAKAKEYIHIRFESYKSPNGVKTYEGNQTDMTLKIIELRNKKMKLSLEDTRIEPNGSETSYTESYELER